MAILNGLIRKMRGSAGDFTFSQSQGRTIVSEKITATSDRKTSTQQCVRMRWANIVQMYKGVMLLLDCAFESKAAGVSDYNMFVKLNMQQQAVYLTKSQVSGGVCVYIIVNQHQFNFFQKNHSNPIANSKFIRTFALANLDTFLLIYEQIRDTIH